MTRRRHPFNRPWDRPTPPASLSLQPRLRIVLDGEEVEPRAMPNPPHIETVLAVERMVELWERLDALAATRMRRTALALVLALHERRRAAVTEARVQAGCAAWYRDFYSGQEPPPTFPGPEERRRMRVVLEAALSVPEEPIKRRRGRRS